MTSALSCKLCQSFPCFILYSKAKLACYSRYPLTSYFCIPIPYDAKDIFFGVSSRRSCKSSQNGSTSASSALLVGPQTWITVILNGLPWKPTEIILSFLTLHPSTAFHTLLLTIRVTPFLLMDSCPQQQIEWSSELNSPIPVHFSSLILKMLMFTRHFLLDHIQFTLIHGLNIPGFYLQYFYLQYFSLQHWTLFSPPDTSTGGHCFCLAEVLHFFFWSYQ